MLKQHGNNTSIKRHLLETIASTMLIVLFTYTAVNKLQDRKQFQNTLNQSILLKGHGALLSWLIPSIELMIVVLLLFQFTRIIGLYLSIFILATFTLYIAGMLLTSKDLPCSCGGVISKLSWKNHIYFNCLFILNGIIGVVYFRKQQRLLSHSPP